MKPRKVYHREYLQHLGVEQGGEGAFRSSFPRTESAAGTLVPNFRTLETPNSSASTTPRGPPRTSSFSFINIY